MWFLFENLIGTTAIIIAMWISGGEIHEKIPCQEITEANLDGAVRNVVYEMMQRNYTSAEYMWSKIECSMNIPTHLKEESVEYIIRHSYAADSTLFDIVSQFTHKFIIQAHLKVRGYKELYHQMNISNNIYNSPQLLSLANIVQSERFFVELYSMFPPEVWMFVFNKDVALRNVENGGSLFVGSNAAFYNQEKGQRNVLVWKPGNLGPQGRWKFMLNKDGETFTIFNPYWNLCLYEEEWEKRFDEQRGNIYASSCLDSDTITNKKWNVVLVPGKDGRSDIQIKSAVRDVNNTIYSETSPELDLDSLRSRVFVSYSSDTQVLEGKSAWRASYFR